MSIMIGALTMLWPLLMNLAKHFFSGTTWQGNRCMRVSVCNWQTNDTDVDRAINAVQLALTKQ